MVADTEDQAINVQAPLAANGSMFDITGDYLVHEERRQGRRAAA
jgi:hypothetical protein